MQDTTEIFLDSLQEDREPEPLMPYIYNNPATKSYIVFEIENIKRNQHPNIALDVFFNKLTTQKHGLPHSLFMQLKEKDLNLFSEAIKSDAALEKLEEFIYVRSSQNRYTDEDGITWEVISRSKREVNLEQYVGEGEYIVSTMSSDDFISSQSLPYGSMGEKRW